MVLRCAAERHVIEISGFTAGLGLCVKFGVVAAEKLFSSANRLALLNITKQGGSDELLA